MSSEEPGAEENEDDRPCSRLPTTRTPSAGMGEVEGSRCAIVIGSLVAGPSQGGT